MATSSTFHTMATVAHPVVMDLTVYIFALDNSSSTCKLNLRIWYCTEKGIYVYRSLKSKVRVSYCVTRRHSEIARGSEKLASLYSIPPPSAVNNVSENSTSELLIAFRKYFQPISQIFSIDCKYLTGLIRTSIARRDVPRWNKSTRQPHLLSTYLHNQKE